MAPPGGQVQPENQLPARQATNPPATATPELLCLGRRAIYTARMKRRLIVLLALLLAPAAAGAQSTTPTAPPVPPFPSTTPPFPTSPPLLPSPTVSAHPGGFPWAIGTAIPQGQLLRYMWIAPQTVVVDTILPVPVEPPAPDVTANGAEQIPASESAPQYAVWRQTAVVPGYWVRQTTAGVYYPQRWTLEQTAPGAYRWRLLPAEVRAR